VGFSWFLLLSLAVAFPTPLRKGVVVLKASVLLLAPAIVAVFDAKKGGDRKTDPPKDDAP
jgi:hypothetical protein